MDGKYVLFTYFGNYALTTADNYRAQIMDGNAVTKFRQADGFTSVAMVLDYIRKYYTIPVENITIKAD